MSTFIVIVLAIVFAVIVLLMTLGFVMTSASVAGAVADKLWPTPGPEQQAAEEIRALLAEIDAEDAKLAAKAAKKHKSALRRSRA